MTDSMIGKNLPNVTLQSTEGGTITLPSALKGRHAVIYFYPKDDTPGCTAQACAYRDSIEQFRKIGCEVYGVSADDMASHGAFRSKFSLNFPLLADTKKELSTALGVSSRDTFLVDPNGKIVQVWRQVSPKTTMSETYESVRRLVAH